MKYDGWKEMVPLLMLLADGVMDIFLWEVAETFHREVVMETFHREVVSSGVFVNVVSEEQ